MEIDKAIEAIELIVKYPETPIGLHTLKAIRLGIEALRRIKRVRSPMGYGYSYKLPGETKD